MGARGSEGDDGACGDEVTTATSLLSWSSMQTKEQLELEPGGPLGGYGERALGGGEGADSAGCAGDDTVDGCVEAKEDLF